MTDTTRRANGPTELVGEFSAAGGTITPNISKELQSLLTVGQAYDDLAARTRNLESRLNEALTALEGRNARILVLEEAMHTERRQYQDDCARRDKEVAEYRAAADQAIGERNEMRIILGNLRTLLLSADVNREPTETLEAEQPRIGVPRSPYTSPTASAAEPWTTAWSGDHGLGGGRVVSPREGIIPG